MSPKEYRPRSQAQRRLQPANAPSKVRTISLGQSDVAESFGANKGLGPDEWTSTVPLNVATPYPEVLGLPQQGAGAEETYQVAKRLRISIAEPGDGVYCPVCHIANIQLAKLHTPCPKCGRALLRFHWD
jgi:hypothetical protein